MKPLFPYSNIFIGGTVEIFFRDNVPGQKSVTIGAGSRPMKSGVYCLRNKLNGRLYIGMARNLETRRSRHWSDLMALKHINKPLLADYQEGCYADICGDGLHPEELFEFEVIIYCRPSELTFFENILINSLNPYYNVHKRKVTSV